MSFIIYEKKGRIANIILNRPEVLNAMNNRMKRELTEIWIDFRDDPEVWVAIVSGAGDRAFSTGSDVKDLAEMHVSGQPIVVENQPLNTGHLELWKPLIAAINGWCVGGGLELALSCDIRIATENARFGLMEPKMGSVANGGGTVRLPNQVPFAIAMEMILTGDTIDARRAYQIGLINQVVSSPNELMPAAEKMAERVLACAPLAVRVSKEQALRGFNVPTILAVSTLRNLGMLEVRSSQDGKEGATAFVEKRKPVWKGK